MLLKSKERLAGHRLMVGFDGTELNRDLMFMIDRLHVGGIVLFSRNIQTPDQIRTLCFSIQGYAAACGMPPLFIAIDQEGGMVARLKTPFTQFPGNSAMNSVNEAEDFARITANELNDIGVNLNFAPVLDVAPEGFKSIMAGRIFGSSPQWVSDLGTAIIQRLQENGIIATAKHFPGIGRTVLDSHLELPVLENADISELLNFDLIPFESAIRCDVGCIMLSHILYPAIDPDYPASISIRIAKNLLRDRLRYNRLVVTDDLDMGAIRNHYDLETIIRQVMAADIDMAMICHRTSKIEAAYDEILKNLNDSTEMLEKGMASVERILKLKADYRFSDNKFHKARGRRSYPLYISDR